jgi:hypothetical protein
VKASAGSDGIFMVSTTASCECCLGDDLLFVEGFSGDCDRQGNQSITEVTRARKGLLMSSPD